MVYGLGNQTRYPLNADVAFPGLVKQRIRMNTGINAAGESQQSVPIDIGTAADSTAYTITVGDRPVSFTSDGSATATEIRDGLIAKLRTDSIISSKFTVAATDADTLTLTHRLFGVNEVVTVGGGGTGYALGTVVNSATSAALPYGLVVAAKTSYPLVDGLPTVSVPSASGDIILGIAASTLSNPQEVAGQTDGYSRKRDLVNILQQGVIWTTSEAAIAVGDTLYFRHTASGAFTKTGVVSGSSGTGKSVLPASRPDGPSVLLSDGTILVPIAINLP